MFEDPEFQRLHAEGLAAHEAKIDAALREIETSHPKLYELLVQEIRNLRADSKFYLLQRDNAFERVERANEQAEKHRQLMWEARNAEQVAKIETNKLRGLLHDLQKEVASWPRPA